MFTIGIDIGGTKIAGVLLGPEKNVLREEKVLTPAEDPQAIIDAVVKMIRSLAGTDQVAAVGVAAAGFIDEKQSEVMYAPNLNWRNEPLKAKLEAELGLKVIIENDANAAGWAEYRFGAGRGASNMVMVTVGTGVGGAMVLDGKMYRGGFGLGAEFGHMRFIPDGRQCGCGQRGCLEQYGSGTSLLTQAKERIKSGDRTGARLVEIAGSVEQITGSHIYAGIKEGDPFCNGLIADLGANLGQAIASLAAVIDPDVVVIGGGVSVLGDLLLNPVRESYLKHLPARGFRPELKIICAELVNDAGAIGVADLARENTPAE